MSLPPKKTTRAPSGGRAPLNLRSQMRARHSREGCLRCYHGRSVKECPSLNSYRKGTLCTNVCASAPHRCHCLATARALHHRRWHPVRAPLLPALSCSCKSANVWCAMRGSLRVASGSPRGCTATHTQYSRAHMLRARTHSHAAHGATRS